MTDMIYPAAKPAKKMEAITPTNFRLYFSINKKWHHFQIGNKPKVTPNWYLRQLVKRIYGSKKIIK